MPGVAGLKKQRSMRSFALLPRSAEDRDFYWNTRSLYRMKRVPVIVAILVGIWSAWTHGAAASQAEDYFRKGYLAAMSREWNQAIEWYSKAVEINPGNAEVYFQRAITYEMTGKPRQAIEDYEKAIKLKPTSYLAMEYLAKLYESEGQYDKAVDLYTRALPLVQDAKWRSIVKWWIAEAKKKSEAGKQNADRRGKTAPQDSRF